MISDAAYEALPSQLLSLVRPDPVARVIAGLSALTVQFTGCVEGAYLVQTSADLRTWNTFPGSHAVTNGTFSVMMPSSDDLRFFRASLVQ